MRKLSSAVVVMSSSRQTTMQGGGSAERERESVWEKPRTELNRTERREKATVCSRAREEYFLFVVAVYICSVRSAVN